jgi:malate/lactate dehydrogenase
VIEVEMNEDERKAFDASVEHVRNLVGQIKI